MLSIPVYRGIDVVLVAGLSRLMEMLTFLEMQGARQEIGQRSGSVGCGVRKGAPIECAVPQTIAARSYLKVARSGSVYERG